MVNFLKCLVTGLSRGLIVIGAVVSCDSQPPPPVVYVQAPTNENDVLQCKGDSACINRLTGNVPLRDTVTQSEVHEAIPPGTYWEMEVTKVKRADGTFLRDRVANISGELNVDFEVHFVRTRRDKAKAGLVGGNHTSTHVNSGETIVDPTNDLMTPLSPSELDTEILKAITLCRCTLPDEVNVSQYDGRPTLRVTARDALIERAPITPTTHPGVKELKTSNIPVKGAKCTEIGHLPSIDDPNNPAKVDSDGVVYQSSHIAQFRDAFNAAAFHDKVGLEFRSEVVNKGLSTVFDNLGTTAFNAATYTDPTQGALTQIIKRHLPRLTVRYVAGGCTANACPSCSDAAGFIEPLFVDPLRTYDLKAGDALIPHLNGKPYPPDQATSRYPWKISGFVLPPDWMFQVAMSNVLSANDPYYKADKITTIVDQLLKVLNR